MTGQICLLTRLWPDRSDRWHNACLNLKRIWLMLIHSGEKHRKECVRQQFQINNSPADSVSSRLLPRLGWEVSLPCPPRAAGSQVEAGGCQHETPLERWRVGTDDFAPCLGITFQQTNHVKWKHADELKVGQLWFSRQSCPPVRGSVV